MVIKLFGGRWHKTVMLKILKTFCYITKTLQTMKRRMGKNSSAKTILQRIPITGSNNCYPRRHLENPRGTDSWEQPAGRSVRNWDQFWAIRYFENDITKMSSIQIQVSFTTPVMMITSKMRLAKGYQKQIIASYFVLPSSATVLRSSLLFLAESLCLSK